MTKPPSAGGMRAFLTIWFGQLISMIGSQLTGFALGVWVYDQTGSVLWLALSQVALQSPYVILSPLAGVLVDRWNRRTAMIVSDFGAGFAVLTTALLFITGHLQPWMVIPINFVMSAFNSLMWPAYTSSVTLLVPKEQYGRANGFVQLGEALPQVAGPGLAGALYVIIHLGNLALIDFGTYVFSVVLMLFFVRIPRPPRSEDDRQGKGSFWKEMRFGWDYIVARKGLFSLLMFFLGINFVYGVMGPLFVPLILDNWKADVFGYLSMIMGIGMLAGTVVMSAWGGGKRKIYTLLGAGFVGPMFLVAMGLRASIPLLAVCSFGFMFSVPLLDASSQAIWQSKVAPDVQGRVFAVRRSIAWSSQIIAPLLAAPLAENVFKPAMSPGGALASLVGPIIGVGANRGIGMLISVLGVLSILISVAAFSSSNVRNVELDLPDHVASPEDRSPAALNEPAD